MNSFFSEPCLKPDRPQTPKSNCNSPEPERKLHNTGDGDGKPTSSVQINRYVLMFGFQ